MKLKTDMQWMSGGINRPDPFGGPVDDMIHDAAAAHALLQALDRWRHEQSEYLKGRADETMREWGFVEDGND